MQPSPPHPSRREMAAMQADKIPDEIMEEAFRLTESAWQLKHPELAMKVARALMARDKRSAACFSFS